MSRLGANMGNPKELAAIFEQFAVLLDLKGENPFKVRAYTNAARILETFPGTISQLLEEPPQGFGKSLLEKVREFSETGTVTDFVNLLDSTPKGLLELLKLQGLGPKKVKALYEGLGITSIEELEKAIFENKLLTLKGFGEKMQAKILESIEFYRKFAGQFLLFEAEEIATEMSSYLQGHFPTLPISIAGSIRRKKEIVKDIDILMAANDSKLIMQTFISSPLVEKVLAEGNTRSSILTKKGMQIDLRVVSPQSWIPALCYFTGSKEHNTRLRGHAQSLGLKLNEYGLYKNDITIPTPTEEKLYEALNLSYIPPELRENMGEIELAANNNIPNLVKSSDICGIIHVHTHASDGHNSIEEIVQAVQKLGYSWLGISDHSKSAKYAGGLSIEAIIAQHKEIDELNKSLKNFKIFKGIESDILQDGSLDYPPEILEKFDFVIASIHSHLTMSYDEMTERIIKAIKNPFTDILGHPTGRLLLERPGISFDMDKVLQAAEAQSVIVEINAHPLRLDLDWRVIRANSSRNMNYVIGTDAHSIEGLTDVNYGVYVARKGALSANKVLNCLTAVEFSKFIQSRRKKCGKN